VQSQQLEFIDHQSPILSTPTPLWYAVRVRSNFERTVGTILDHKGVEQFVPTFKARRVWADRVKTLDVPLFPGYVFCRIPLDARNAVVTTAGVVGLVSCGREPIPVSQTEIDAIRRVTENSASAEPWPFLRVGQTVRINHGSLSGIEGILVRVKNSWRLVVSVTLLERSVAVELDSACVSPVQ
jgi:transcription antitermination factor NusG